MSIAGKIPMKIMKTMLPSLSPGALRGPQAEFRRHSERQLWRSAVELRPLRSRREMVISRQILAYDLRIHDIVYT